MITWLASYPKSGNTWVRSFLAAYSFSGECPDGFDLNLIPRITASESRAAAFAELAGVPFNELSDEQIDGLRSEVQRRLAKTLGPNQVVKTHNARVRHRGTPLICREYTARAIYVVRNPLDVVDSLADHCGTTVEDVITLLGDRRHRLGGSAGNVPQYLDSWSGHVKSWVNNSAFPAHLVRYEDLLNDPIGRFREILQFLEREVVEERLAKAVNQTSFEALRENEQQSGFAEVSQFSKSGTFFRRGISDAWKSVLQPDQIQIVLHEHGKAMQLAGYEHPQAESAHAGCPVAHTQSSHVDESRQSVADRTAKPKPPTRLYIPAEWKRWIAENLLRGSDPDELSRLLVDKGFSESLSRLELDAALTHPYLDAARGVLAQPKIDNS